jgi:hypothetical protein
MIYLGGIYGVSKPKNYRVWYRFSPYEHKNAPYKSFGYNFVVVTAQNIKGARKNGLSEIKSIHGKDQIVIERVEKY